MGSLWGLEVVGRGLARGGTGETRSAVDGMEAERSAGDE